LIQQFVWSEISPNAPGTAASSKTVQNSSNALAAGIAGPLDDGAGIDIVAILVGATGGTLNVYMQQGMADGTWYDVVSFPQLTAAESQVTYKTNLSALALNAGTGGTTTSYATPVLIGSGIAPALIANASVQGQGFDRMRLVMVAGSGTSVGALVKIYATVQRPRLHD
jgi:hypothetical protein